MDRLGSTRRSRRQLASWRGCGLVAVLALAAPAAAAPEKPAASMSDLRDHFAACFQPPAVAGTRVTFYFALDARGSLLGRPRATWIGFTGDAQEREKRLADFVASFRKCLPVALDRGMAAALPGEVYFLQFVVGANGREQQVLLRPFGSHGFGPPLLPDVEPAEAPLPGARGPDVRRFRPFRPQPGRGPFFHPPIVVPFGRRP